MLSNPLRSILFGMLCLGMVSQAVTQIALRPMPTLVLEDLSPAIQQAIIEAQTNLENLQRSEAAVPILAGAYGQLGDVLLVHGLTQPATVAYENAQQLDSRRVDWPYLLAVIAIGQGQVDAALSLLNQALSLDPWDGASLIQRGRLNLAQGQLDSAIQDFERVLQLTPESAAALAGLGEAALQQQQFDEAIRRLEQSLALQPTATRLFQPLGLAYRGVGRLNDARAVMAQMGDRDVVFLDPAMDRVKEQSRSPQFYQEAALVAAEAGDLAGARILLVQALTLSPNDPLIVTNYGEVLAREGLLPEARQAFLKLIELQPNSPDAWFYLAQIEELLGRMEAAAGAYRRLAELDPLDFRATEGLAFIALASGQYRQAQSQFSELAEDASGASNQIRFRYWEAIAWIGLQQYTQADAMLGELMRDGLSDDPDVMMARARLAATGLGSSVDLAQAFVWAQSVYDSTPGIESAATLAMLHAKRGEFFEAQEYQAQAMFEALRDGMLERREDLREEMDLYRQEQPATRPFGATHPVFSHRRLD